MQIDCLPLGYLEANCYIVSSEGQAAVIDPGGHAEKVQNFLEDKGLQLKAILLTHAHDDHTGGVNRLRELLPAPVYMHKGDLGLSIRRTGRCFEEPEDIRFYEEGDRLPLGSVELEILETPGHTPGGVSIRCEDALFTGDTLFKGSTGRADLGGDFDTELRSLKKLALLPGDLRVYPGHGEATTLDRERQLNPFMKRGMALSEQGE